VTRGECVERHVASAWRDKSSRIVANRRELRFVARVTRDTRRVRGECVASAWRVRRFVSRTVALVTCGECDGWSHAARKSAMPPLGPMMRVPPTPPSISVQAEARSGLGGMRVDLGVHECRRDVGGYTDEQCEIIPWHHSLAPFLGIIPIPWNSLASFLDLRVHAHTDEESALQAHSVDVGMARRRHCVHVAAGAGTVRTVWTLCPRPQCVSTSTLCVHVHTVCPRPHCVCTSTLWTWTHSNVGTQRPCPRCVSALTVSPSTLCVCIELHLDQGVSMQSCTEITNAELH
jgi:hypothetical protein